MSSPARSLIALLTFLPLLAIGCGSGGIAPNKDGTLPLLQSPELATGAWTIGGASSPNSAVFASPIGGFLGALTASGTTVSGYFNIASSDPANPYQTSTCFGPDNFGVGISTVFVHGTASNGLLTLDGNFATSSVHFFARLSPDRRLIMDGSYTVAGPCASNAPQIYGHWNAPVDGKYIGTANSSTGTNFHLDAQFTQGSTINGFGEIPVLGSIDFRSSTCNATVQLRDASASGYITFLTGFSTPGPGNDSLILTEEDADSNTLNFDSWSFSNSTCGQVYNDQYNSGILHRQ